MVFNSKYELVSVPMPNENEIVILYFDHEQTEFDDVYATFQELKEILPEDTLVICMEKAFEIEKASIEDLIQMRNACDALLMEHAAGRIE